MRFWHIVCFASVVVSGCGLRHAPDLHASSVPAASPVEESPDVAPAAAQPSEHAGPAVPRVRQSSGPTIEAHDPALAAALARATLEPTPVNLRALAAEYHRLGIADLAVHHAQRAAAIDPGDAVSHGMLARLWRDAGFPALGLTAAHRAVFLAPEAAGHRNTLGTVLQALGHRDLARQEYARAVALDARAWYAFNNLCYAWILDVQPGRAIENCRRALDLQPGVVAAQNNLALAFAMAGDTEASARWFHASGDPARATYNEGVTHLAQGRLTAAVQSFQAAHALNPGLHMARRRALQAAAAIAEE